MSDNALIDAILKPGRTRRAVTRTNLGVMLRLYMEIGGVSVRKLAPKIGISPATLNRIVNGKQPDLESYRKLQTWLWS